MTPRRPSSRRERDQTNFYGVPRPNTPIQTSSDPEGKKSPGQGLTLVHFSAQLKRILLHRGVIGGCLRGV